jgi:hypothetical protein
MTVSQFALVSLAVARCAAAILAVGRNTRQIEKRQPKEVLESWEDEGGQLAPSEAPHLAAP